MDDGCAITKTFSFDKIVPAWNIKVCEGEVAPFEYINILKSSRSIELPVKLATSIILLKADPSIYSEMKRSDALESIVTQWMFSQLLPFQICKQPKISTKTIRPISVEDALIVFLSETEATLGGKKPPKFTLSEELEISRTEAGLGLVVFIPTCALTKACTISRQ